MHTPVEVSERAATLVRELDADVLIAFGGESTTGLCKAIAYRTDLPQTVIPTTYASSEAGEKVTIEPDPQPAGGRGPARAAHRLVTYNASAACRTLEPVSRLFGGGAGAAPGAALHDFARSLGAPLRLDAFGFDHDDVAAAARIAASKPYPNPAPFDEAGLAALLHRAIDGERPDT